jgi:prephenate dehydratase
MALLQCMDFLKKYPNIKLVEDKETLLKRRRIQEKQLKGIAAMQTKQLQMYDLEIIAPEIRRE